MGSETSAFFPRRGSPGPNGPHGDGKLDSYLMKSRSSLRYRAIECQLLEALEYDWSNVPMFKHLLHNGTVVTDYWDFQDDSSLTHTSMKPDQQNAISNGEPNDG